MSSGPARPSHAMDVGAALVSMRGFRVHAWGADRTRKAHTTHPSPLAACRAQVIVFQQTRRGWGWTWSRGGPRLVSKAVKAAFDQAVTGLGSGARVWQLGSDNGIRQIPGILGSVSLAKLSVTAYTAAAFAAEASRLTGLTSLDFSGPIWMGERALLWHLRTIRSRASQLRQLSISNVRVGSLDSLGALSSLTSLTVVSCGLQADALAGLGGSSNLKQLDIHDNTGLCSLASLGELGALQKLRLDSCGLRELAPLAGCPSLVWLDASGNKQLSSLVGLGGALQTLDASDCDLRAGSLAGLAGCTQLQELNLRRNSMGSLVGLGGLGQLKKLAVSECHLEQGALGLLSGCSNLEWLSARANEHIGSLAGLGGSLVSLHAGGCGLVGVAELVGCSNLEWLNVRENSSLVSLVGLGGCTALKYLQVLGCDLEPRALTALAHCANLEEINFLRNQRLNEDDEFEALKALGWRGAALKWFNINGGDIPNIGM
jgi:Leucine-rich repeat (LRR) protein